jgi:zinc-ribbon domain
MQIVCPHCGAVGNIPDQAQPKPLRCRKCGAKFQPKPFGIADDFESKDSPIDLPDDINQNLNIVVADDSVELVKPAPLPAREPWFYWFLECWGKFYFFIVMLCGFGTICLFVLLVIVALTTRKDLQTVTSQYFALSGAYVVIYLFIIIPFVIMLLTIAALIFLLVDQARNIRQIRLNSDRDRRPCKLDVCDSIDKSRSWLTDPAASCSGSETGPMLGIPIEKGFRPVGRELMGDGEGT